MAKQYRNRFKIVTLDGQVMNPGGSMTGGSVNKEAGILSRANELEKLTRREQELTEKKKQLEIDGAEARRAVDEVEYQLTAARDRLREAEDQVLLLQGQQKQYEILLSAVEEAAQSAEREQRSITERLTTDGQRLASQQAKVQVFTVQLAETEAALASLEGEESETAARTNALTEQMTHLRTGSAAMEAERTTALGHVEDLRQLQISLEGDRLQKLSVVEAMEAVNLRLGGQIAAITRQQEENEQSLTAVRQRLAQVQTKRAETEAAKTRREREAQEKSKDILNMERACAHLEQKKLTANMEERQIVDKLWDSYGLTPGTAPEKR
jgi:chromosome segregation protein